MKFQGALLAGLSSLVLAVRPGLSQQIVPDTTLGAESSEVIQDFRGFIGVQGIEGGAQRGNNLFHSFEEFGIDENQAGFFIVDGLNIQNILARVTGTKSSEILGTLGTQALINNELVISPANLFLINPNGIFFGEGSNLNLGGSFTGTTASGLTFGDDGIFSIVNPTMPSNLLTVQPSALLFDQANPSLIEIRSNAPNPFGGFGLQVNNAQALRFISGEFRLDGGQLNAPGGRIEVAALGEPSTVLFDEVGQIEILGSPQRNNIFLLNQSRLSTIADGGGETRVYGDNISISGGSQIAAGIAPGVGSPARESGNILVEATGELELLSSSIGNAILGIGNSGRIEVIGQSIYLEDGSTIGSINGGNGSAGSVMVRAEDKFLLSGRNASGSASGVFSASLSLDAFVLAATVGVEPTQTEEFLRTLESLGINPAEVPENTGNGGDLDIQAGSIRLTDGAQVASTSFLSRGASGNVNIQSESDISVENSSDISTASYGQGDAGQIQIKAGGIIKVQGGDGNFGRSQISSSLEPISTSTPTQVRKGGDIEVSANSLILVDGGAINASTASLGDGGDITLNVRNKTVVDGLTEDGVWRSGIGSEVQLGASGIGGSIELSTGNLDVINGGIISVNSFGEGGSGDITIAAGDTVRVATASPDGRFASEISGIIGVGGKGNGGEIQISAGELKVSDTAVINASTSGQGKAGELLIIVDGKALLNGLSGVGSTVSQGAVGDGGQVRVVAGELEITDGAVLTTETFGQGNSGKLIVQVVDSIRVSGTSTDDVSRSRISSGVNVGGSGDGGELQVTAGDLEVSSGGLISASTSGNGKGGDLIVNVLDHITIDGTSASGILRSGIGSEVASGAVGRGGNVDVNARTLTLTNGGILSAITAGIGNAGNFNISVEGLTTLDGTTEQGGSSGIFTATNTGATGNGGTIQASTGDLKILNGAGIDASTFGQGDAGEIILNIRETARFDGTTPNELAGSGVFNSVSVGAVGNGSKLQLAAGNLEITNGAVVNASTFGEGNAGELVVVVRENILIDGTTPDGSFSSGIASTVAIPEATGNGGRVQVSAKNITIENGANINASTFGKGDAGEISLAVQDSVRLSGTTPNGAFSSGIFSTVEAGAAGNGGEISVSANSLKVTDSAKINNSTFSQGDAGDFQLTVSELELTVGGQLLTQSFGNGSSGNTLVIAKDSILIQGSRGSTGAPSGIFSLNGFLDRQGTGQSGDIEVFTPSLKVSAGGTIDASTFNDEIGGNIKLNVDQLSIARGGQIETASLGMGSAGNLIINANQEVEISGFDTNFDERVRLFQTTVTPGTADDALAVVSRADSSLSVQALQNGQAGNLILNTPDLRISDRGQIIAESATGDGGSIFIGSKPNDSQFADIPIITPDTVLLRNNGFISTTAGDNQNPGNGGNITINTPFLISLPNENSDIIANAFQGTGGNITINADAILNFELQDEPNVETLRSNRTNDISASSAIGSSGVLNLAGLNVDPAQGAAQLPIAPAPPNQVDRTCAAQTTNANSFILSGRGGIPASPADLSSAPLPTSPWLNLPETVVAPPTPSTALQSAQSVPDTASFIEASTWQRQADGAIALVAQTSSSLNSNLSCSHWIDKHH